MGQQNKQAKKVCWDLLTHQSTKVVWAELQAEESSDREKVLAEDRKDVFKDGHLEYLNSEQFTTRAELRTF